MTVTNLGVDKSSYDGRVDWKLAKSRGIDVATIRASMGLASDGLHQSESDNAKAAGVLVAPYHWYVPSINAIKQADKFLLSTKGGDLPPMLDLEDYGTTRGYAGIWNAGIKPWLLYVESAVGVRPWIYTSPGYIRSYLSKETEIIEWPFVIANYDVPAPQFPKPLTPLSITGWQFGDGRDARYYGFTEAWGCALYVFHDIQKFIKSWSGNFNSNPVPEPVGYTKATALFNVTIRSGAAKTYASIYPFVFIKGQVRDILDVVQVGADTWIEIDAGKWVAAIYGGQKLVELK